MRAVTITKLPQWTRLLSALLLLAFPLLPASSQEQRIRRGNCTPEAEATTRADSRRSLPVIHNDWDGSRVYRQLVILVSFSDLDFLSPTPQATYDSLFNQPGYNQGLGPGCVADYFREQSNGLFNLQFDVYGPFKVSSKACPYSNPNSSTYNTGTSVLTEATKLFLARYPDKDFSPYDWYDDGYITQAIYVYAGYNGNESEKGYGYIWPNTSSFSAQTTPDGKKLTNYSCSGERWSDDRLFGIGTICHEYCHSLGLPDIYPTNNWTYSAVDSWDLMDGGNYINYGWCPPNFTALEKILMGWLTPSVLTFPTTVTEMNSVSDGGVVYRINHTSNEYYLLENHQWKGWDSGLPGRGLLITHVNYSESRWRNNSVNNVTNAFNYHLVAADNLDYDGWMNKLGATKVTDVFYQNPDQMNSYYLSGAAYPSDTLNRLTDTTVPASLMYNPNINNDRYLSKSITNIRMSADGAISFDFMKDESSAIRTISSTTTEAPAYNLMGQRVGQPRKGLYIRNNKKVIFTNR